MAGPISFKYWTNTKMILPDHSWILSGSVIFLRTLFPSCFVSHQRWVSPVSSSSDLPSEFRVCFSSLWLWLFLQYCTCVLNLLLGSFSKPRLQWQRERFDLCIYFCCPLENNKVKWQNCMTVFWRTCTTMANFSCLPLELNAVITYLAWAAF